MNTVDINLEELHPFSLLSPNPTPPRHQHLFSLGRVKAKGRWNKKRLSVTGTNENWRELLNALVCRTSRRQQSC
ncbi:hypothetical protein SOVF_010390 [Spinacia oleracea]|nr:hypothetical protein SOVF_010390 [Spinacia oleracea]